MKRFILILSLLAIIARPAMSDPEISGFLMSNAKIKFKQEQEFIQQETWLRLKLRSRTDRARLYGDLDLRYDPLYHSKPRVDIREAYADISLSKFDFRFGRQILVWGKADEFNPTDFINPEDYREFVFLSKADRKIGIFCLRLDGYFGNFKLEGIFIPTFTPASIPTEKANPWTSYQIKDIIADPKISLANLPEPLGKLENSECALKFGGMMRGFDFSFSYFEGFFDLPVMFQKRMVDLKGDYTIQILPKYKRFRAWGFDFATFLGGLGLRGEAAYTHSAYYTTTNRLDSDGIVEKPNLSFVLGGDYTFLENLYVNLQWVSRFIFDYEQEIEENQIENRLVFVCRDTFLDEEVELGLRSMVYNLKDFDYMLKPYVKYSVTDGVDMETGVYLFGGKERTMFGQFRENDYGFLKVSYYF